MKVGWIFLIFLSFSLMAGIKSYESTDNTGLNKREQIEAIEKYLGDLSASLKEMDSKIDDQAKKMKSMEESVKLLKEADTLKLVEEKKDQPKVADIPAKYKTEIEKLKSDILFLKNKDIEKLKADFYELKNSFESLRSSK